MYKLEELSIADLRAAQKYALDEWDNAVKRMDQESTEYWYHVESTLELEINNRIKQIFP